MSGGSKRFKSTVICNGLGEYKYTKIEDNIVGAKYMISLDSELDFLLNSLNEDIVNSRKEKLPLHMKIKNKIIRNFGGGKEY